MKLCESNNSHFYGCSIFVELITFHQLISLTDLVSMFSHGTFVSPYWLFSQSIRQSLLSEVVVELSQLVAKTLESSPVEDLVLGISCQDTCGVRTEVHRNLTLSSQDSVNSIRYDSVNFQWGGKLQVLPKIYRV